MLSFNCLSEVCVFYKHLSFCWCVYSISRSFPSHCDFPLFRRYCWLHKCLGGCCQCHAAESDLVVVWLSQCCTLFQQSLAESSPSHSGLPLIVYRTIHSCNQVVSPKGSPTAEVFIIHDHTSFNFKPFPFLVRIWGVLQLAAPCWYLGHLEASLPLHDLQCKWRFHYTLHEGGYQNSRGLFCWFLELLVFM